MSVSPRLLIRSRTLLGVTLAIAVMATHGLALATPPAISLNPTFFGRWRGAAPIDNLCSGGKRDERGEGIITLRVERPKMAPGKNFVVLVHADWGCFAEMTLPGFVFSDELWASSDDRMTVLRLSLKNAMVSGTMRFDLNGRTLKLDFENLVRSP